MTRVSVIIPCYNREGLVREAIESALAQDLPDLEVIVVDDGSTDGSWQVIGSFGARVRGIRVPNGGVALARNIGLARATGTLVKFHDSDDLLEPGALRAQIADLARVPEGGLPVGTGRLVDGDGRPVLPGLRPIHVAAEGGQISRSTLLYRSLSVGLVLYPADVLRAVGGFRANLRFAEDHDIGLRLCRAGYGFHLFNTPTAVVREHGGSRITTTVSAEAFAELPEFYAAHAAAFDESPGGPLRPEERAAFARMIWERGRLAVNFGYVEEARALFELSHSLSGLDGRAASRPLKFLYKFVDPVVAERIVGVAKRILRRP